MKTQRLISALFVAALLAIGVSQQGDPGLNRNKDAEMKAAPAQILGQLPTPKSNEIVVVFESGHAITLTVGQVFSTPKGSKFWSAWGKGATYGLMSTGQNSGNANWEVIAR